MNTNHFALKFAQLLLKYASDLIEGDATVRGVVARLQTYSEPMKVSQAIKSIRFADIPADSPVREALKITPKECARDREQFKKLMTEQLNVVESSIIEIESLSLKYHPSEAQREYIAKFFLDGAARLEKQLNETAPQQISFELPKG